MDKVKIISKTPTGAVGYKGELCLQTGIIAFNADSEGVTEYSHIMSETMDGYRVIADQEVKPEETPEKEIQEESLEELKEEEVKEPAQESKEEPRQNEVKKKKKNK